MFKNYLIIGWRNLMKTKGYSAINIGGLAVGMGCFLLIALFIQHELSYDRYHKNFDNIYRVVHAYDNSDKDSYQVWGNAPVGTRLKKDFSEVVEKVQFSGRSSSLLKYGENAFQEDNCFYVDESVFKVFSWDLLAGNPEEALKAPYSIVLTESMAQKYFGNEDPIGKTLEGIGGRAASGDYTVTGVMEDVPSNSHFSFDFLMSMSSFYQTRPSIFDAWGYVDFYTYFLVPDQFDKTAFLSKIPDFLAKHEAFTDEYYYNMDIEPLSDAYLRSTAGRQPGVTGSLANIYIFAIIGLFILVIACINFMNLATARSLERAKEVGIRKVIGAHRWGLISQFFAESLVMVVLAALIGLLLVTLCLPSMQELTGKDFVPSDIFELPILLMYGTAALLTGLLAGSYPALILSGFTPVSVLKGLFRNAPKGANLRRSLVVFQFSLSIALIACTAIVYFQLGFLLNKDLGFEREQMLVINFNGDGEVLNNLETIKANFAALTSVKSVAASRTVPGTHFPNAGTWVESAEGTMVVGEPALFEVDIDFIPHYGIEMAAGRSYSRDFPSDTIASLVMNEAAAKQYGYTNPTDIIGKRFEQWGREGQVVGVTKDFNYQSLHQEVAPLTFRLQPLNSGYLSLKIQSQNLSGTLAEIRNKWETLVPHRQFQANFLNEAFNEQYIADIRFKKLFTLFSFLAIFIACLGLLGLATYSATQRTKEIGIRKVLGAKAFNIVKLLSTDFLKLVVVAIVISIPFSWYAMHRWLRGYAYQIEIDWWVFLLSGLIALFIAFITVSFLALRASNANPVSSLRSE